VREAIENSEYLILIFRAMMGLNEEFMAKRFFELDGRRSILCFEMIQL
jgi:hypothetical protein